LRNIGTFRCGALIDPVTLTFDLLTLKSVWESHVTCAKFRLPRPFGFRVRADVRDIRQTDGRTDRRTTDADHRLMPPPSLRSGGIITQFSQTDRQTDRHTGTEQTVTVLAVTSSPTGVINVQPNVFSCYE